MTLFSIRNLPVIVIPAPAYARTGYGGGMTAFDDITYLKLSMFAIVFGFRRPLLEKATFAGNMVD